MHGVYTQSIFISLNSVDGGINIWDRESGTFLYRVPAPQPVVPSIRTGTSASTYFICSGLATRDGEPSRLVVAGGHTGGVINIWMSSIDGRNTDSIQHAGATDNTTNSGD